MLLLAQDMKTPSTYIELAPLFTYRLGGQNRTIAGTICPRLIRRRHLEHYLEHYQAVSRVNMRLLQTRRVQQDVRLLLPQPDLTYLL